MAIREIPLFPLGNVVLFPGAAVPLHIFEPRYRQMTADAIEGERLIGMVAVRPEAAHGMAGDPPVYDIGCAGFIEQHQQLADGRYQIVLRATHRFRVEQELPRTEKRLYRVARVEELPEAEGDLAAAGALRSRIVEHLEEIAHHALGAGGSHGFDPARLDALDPASFVNGVAQSIALPPQEKQGLLDADTIEERMRRLEGALGFHLAARSQGASGSSETVH